MFQQLKYVIRSDNLISIEKMDINNPFFYRRIYFIHKTRQNN